MHLRSHEDDVYIDATPFHIQILNQAKRYGSAVVAVTDAESGKSLSFKDLHDKAYALAAFIGNSGVSKGDVACICLPNCIEYPIIFLGVSIIGGTTSGTNPDHTKDDLLHFFADCECKYVFTNVETYEKVSQACKILPVELIFVLGDDTPPEAINLNQIIAQTPPNYCIDRDIDFAPDDTLILLYTSGTTGKPKGVMITHRNISAATAILKAAVLEKLTGIRNERRTIASLPFFHGSGFWALCYCLLNKYHTIVIPKFDPVIMLQCIEKYKVDTLNVGLLTVAFLAEDPIVDKFDLRSVKIMLCGAGSLGKDLYIKLNKRFPQVTDLLQGYGMTEVVVFTHLTPIGLRRDLRHGSCGKLLPNYEARLIDVATGQDHDGAYQSGELWVRSPAVMKGYFNDSEATKDAIDTNGWLRTGDIFYYDRDGFFFFVDRLKELITVTGLLVLPSELDKILLSHPDVAEAAVVGVTNAHSGQVPRAFVVRKEGSAVSAAQIADFVKSKVSPHKMLSGGVYFVDELPKTASGRVMRRLLRDKDVSSNQEEGCG